MWADGSEFRGASNPRHQHIYMTTGVPVPPEQRRNRVVPVGTMGEAITLRVRGRRAAVPPKVAGQIETPRPPDPIMRRSRADREEKRVKHGNGLRREETAWTPTTPIREGS